MYSLKINPVRKGRNRYCGPAVISALTGMTTDDASKLIRSVTGKRSVTGTHTKDIAGALAYCGIQGTTRYKAPKGKGITLAAWLAKDRNPDSVYLISAGWHWQLVQGDKFVCGITKEIVPITDKKVKRRARVAGVYELNSGQQITIPTEQMAKAKKPDASHLKFWRECKRLCDKWDCEAYRDGKTIWVYPPSWITDTELDPFTDDHFVDTWEQALDRLNTYVEYLEHRKLHNENDA